MLESDKSVLFIKEMKFPLGELVTTPKALASISHEDMQTALSLHASGNWGLTDKHDTEANNHALEHGGRLLSVYDSSEKVRFWIITEADYSSTCILLPMDY